MDPRSDKPPPTVLLFLKAPAPGAVKTRLANRIGISAATGVYRFLVESQIRRIPPGWNLEVHFTPESARREMEEWLGECAGFYPQVEGDLGARLEAATRAAFQRSATRVFCIGADCPFLNPPLFREALDILEGAHDLVFGPADDGGYYLLGLKHPAPFLFSNIPWSSPNTLEASLAAARNAGLTTERLPRFFDIDTREDLNRAIELGTLPPELLSSSQPTPL